MRVVDFCFPVASGQRELIIGDRQTGKSSVLLSSALNSASRFAAVVYRKSLIFGTALIGSRFTLTLRAGISVISAYGQITSSILASPGTSMVSAVYICPLACSSVMEAGRYAGSHSAACYDDLSKHAVSYRQLCLFLKKPAGREAFPSDIFFVHARILERSCNLACSQSSGSSLCLPVVETLQNDLSAYIATNVVSITDGQLYCDTSLFGAAQCPAVSIERSVSRVGAKSLPPVYRATSFGIYRVLSEYRQGRLAYRPSQLAITRCFIQRSAA